MANGNTPAASMTQSLDVVIAQGITTTQPFNDNVSKMDLYSMEQGNASQQLFSGLQGGQILVVDGQKNNQVIYGGDF